MMTQIGNGTTNRSSIDRSRTTSIGTEDTLAARRTFAPIWSARRHPIYRLIEIADEEQRLRLRPEIDRLIQERIVTSRSKLSDQYRGHDAILEEINKALKSLVPSSMPSQRH